MQNASAYANAAGGHAALLEFQKKDGLFSRGNRYIYAYTTSGSLLAHPYERDLVATNRMNWTDARGLPMMRIAAYTASHGGGFIAYLYPAPEGGVIDEKAMDTFEPKIGYVYPVNSDWWIGSGLYFSDMVPGPSPRPDVISEMIGLVAFGAAFGREKGRAMAFAEISNRSGRFVDAKGHYIYAYDYNGTLLAHPYLPGEDRNQPDGSPGPVRDGVDPGPVRYRTCRGRIHRLHLAKPRQGKPGGTEDRVCPSC